MFLGAGERDMGSRADLLAPFSLLFTVLGEGHGALVHAKWSVAPLLTVKLNDFRLFSSKMASELPDASRAPRCLRRPPDAAGALQIPLQ